MSAIAVALVLTAGCGSTATDTAEPTESDNADANPSAGAAARSGKDEQITPGGIAAIVLEHLGDDAVKQFFTYEPEPGSVSVMIQMEDKTPHNFAVQVYAPAQARQFGKAGTCPPKQQLGKDSRCQVLDNGTTVMTTEISQGFSDDNAGGMVLSGIATTPEDGGGMAMYESYDRSPAVTAQDLEDILADPRLTWLTDPATNAAGEAIDLKEPTG
jgi:hypothetical protein